MNRAIRVIIKYIIGNSRKFLVACIEYPQAKIYKIFKFTSVYYTQGTKTIKIKKKHSMRDCHNISF